MFRNLMVAAVLGVVSVAGCSQPGGTDSSPDEGTQTPWAKSSTVDATLSPVVEASAAGTDHATGTLPGDAHDPRTAGESSPENAEGGAASDARASTDPLDPATSEVVHGWLRQMASDTSMERLAAAEALDQMGPDIVPYLAAVLDEGPESEQRGAAAYLIGRVTARDQTLVTGLIKALAASDDVLRRHAFQAVEKLAPEQVRQALSALSALADNPQEDTAYRVRAVRAMAKPGAEAREILPQLQRLAADPTTPELQKAAFDALVRVATPEDTERFLLEVLRDSPDKDLRRLAAKRLVQGALSPQAVRGLIDAFRDAEAEVRNEAIHSLVALGRPAVPQLIEALQSSDVHIRRRAVTALGQLNRLAVDAVPALQARTQDLDPEVRNLATASLRLIQGR